MKKVLPSQARLKELLDYDPLTGGLVWKSGRGGQEAGTPAGNRLPGRNKYLQVGIDYQRCLVHRIIWVWMTGEDPGEMEIDHIDRNPLNNRWHNLRLASVSQNRTNVSVRNKTGLPKGVFPNGSGYMARIVKDRKKHYLGQFKNPDEAHQAYCKAAADLHGEFAA